MLYQMLAGHAPFRGSAADVITAHLRDPVPELPRELELSEVDVILRKAMAKEPDQRYSTASHFKQALSWVSHSSMRKNARLETQIFAPETPSPDVSSSSLRIAKPLRSTNSIPVEEKPNPFSSAITEPHRLTSEFGERVGSKKPVVQREQSRRRSWFLPVLISVIGITGLLLFLGTSEVTDSEPHLQPTLMPKAIDGSMRAEPLTDMSKGVDHAQLQRAKLRR